MMSVYKPKPNRSKPKVSFNDVDDVYSVASPHITVHVDDHRPMPSGLYDARGNPLYRYPAARPIGFIEPEPGKGVGGGPRPKLTE